MTSPLPDSVAIRPPYSFSAAVPHTMTPSFRVGERAELHRQGAKAAARGESASTNPMLIVINQPGRTGENRRVWEDRRDAWQQGHTWQAPEPPSRARTDGGAVVGRE